MPLFTIGKEQFKVKTFDADLNNKLKISSIFNYMQEAAADNADNLGFGYKDLIVKNQAWVLSRALINFYGNAKYGDIITVETWPKGIEKFFALRYFIIYNSDNSIIAKAVTSWLLLNMNNKRPQRLDDLKNHFNNDKDPAIDIIPDKIKEPEDKDFILERTAAYSDIDINLHVNNVKYIEYVFDALENDFLNKYKIKSLQINFLSELKFGEKIKLFKNNFNNKIYFEGIKDSTKVFQTVFEYE